MLEKGPGKTREELRLERIKQRMLATKPDVKSLFKTNKGRVTSKINMKVGLASDFQPFKLKVQEETRVTKTNRVIPVNRLKRSEEIVTLTTGETFSKEEWRQALLRKTHQKCYGLKNGNGKCTRCLRDLNNYDIKLFHLECGPCRKEKEEGKTTRFSFFLTKKETEFILSKYDKKSMTSRGSYVINIIRNLMEKENLE